jgi:poly(3-hydroxybutyrate) depolymerase
MRSEIALTQIGIACVASLAVLGACSSSAPPGAGAPSTSGNSGETAGTGSSGAIDQGSRVDGSSGNTVANVDGSAAFGSGTQTGGSGAPEASEEAGALDAFEDGRSPIAAADAAPPGSGYGGVAGLEDLATVKKAPGCGMPAPQADTMWHPYSVSTPMTRVGPLMRTYYLKLPPNYDNTKAYRLIYQGTNCTGCPTCVMPFDTVAAPDGVIQVALERKDGVHGACFDDQDAMSIEYPFIEAADVDLRQKICFDEHRVFMNGHSSGSWLSEMMGCVYGSAPQPGPTPPGGPLIIRATTPHSGGLAPTVPCNNFPTPGMWTHNHDDPLNSFMGTVAAINRALKVNGCKGSYGNSPTAPYAAPGTNGTCNIYTTCPKEFPVILCDPATGGHEGNKFYAGNWQFLMTF